VPVSPPGAVEPGATVAVIVQSWQLGPDVIAPPYESGGAPLITMGCPRAPDATRPGLAVTVRVKGVQGGPPLVDITTR
jgi:hypothetical protein